LDVKEYILLTTAAIIAVTARAMVRTIAMFWNNRNFFLASCKYLKSTFSQSNGPFCKESLLWLVVLTGHLLALLQWLNNDNKNN
jgi:hypothetical protein